MRLARPTRGDVLSAGVYVSHLLLLNLHGVPALYPDSRPDQLFAEIPLSYIFAKFLRCGFISGYLPVPVGNINYQRVCPNVNLAKSRSGLSQV